MVINEFVAYLDLANMKTAGVLSEKSIRIATYALCGFANFSSIAIQIGGIGGMAPTRQGDLSRLGLKAMLAASLATMMTATIAGAIFQ
jgi:CNT family concentrative nucleoside transporter